MCIKGRRRERTMSEGKDSEERGREGKKGERGREGDIQRKRDGGGGERESGEHGEKIERVSGKGF